MQPESAEGGLWVVLPVNSFQRSKQRLKSCLGPQRGGLSRAMLEDVLDALHAGSTVSGVIVVTRDPGATELAEARNVRVVDEAGDYGMNQAITRGLVAARGEGAQWIVVVPLDIPLLTPGEFDRLVRAYRSRVARASRPLLGIVPSADRDGSNWLCIPSSAVLLPSYGPGSYERHLEQAVTNGMEAVSLQSFLVSLDIDTERDLDDFLSFCQSRPAFRATRTWRYLQRIRPAEADGPDSASHPMNESEYA